MNYKGFTLIELLIVVGIIAISCTGSWIGIRADIISDWRVPS